MYQADTNRLSRGMMMTFVLLVTAAVVILWIVVGWLVVRERKSAVRLARRRTALTGAAELGLRDAGRHR